MLKPTFRTKAKWMLSRAKERNYTPLNILDFLSDEPLNYDWSWRLWWKPVAFMCFLHGIALEIDKYAFAQGIGGNNVKALDRIAQLESNLASDAFDLFWLESMPTWMTVIRTSLAFLGLIGIGWYAVWLSGKADERGGFPYRNFVLPILLVVLLGSGDLMTTTGKSVKDVLNKAGEDVLQVIGAKDRIEQGNALKSYGVLLSSKMKSCDGIPPGEEQSECLKEAAFVMGQLTSIDRQRFGDQPWIRKQEEVTGEVAAGKNQSFLGVDVTAFTDVGGKLLSAAEEVLMIVLDGLSEAFQFVIECGYVLTALLLPIALLLGLSPLQAQGILAWVTAMTGIGTIKFFTNLIIAIGADFLIGSEGAAQVVFGFVSAIFAPLIAIGLAGGGGVAVIIGILQFSSYAANTKQGE